MQQCITKLTQSKKRNYTSKNQKLLASITVFVLIIVLFEGFCAVQTLPSTKIEEATNLNAVEANVNWAKIYGGSQDDRAFYALQTASGYLVVGSSKSVIKGTMVGLAILLDSDGNMVWNQTYLEGYATELRYVLNTTSSYILVGNEFYSSGNISGYVAKTDFQGNLQWKTNLSLRETSKLFSAILAPDGYIVFGLSSPLFEGNSSVWAAKLDVDGNLMWSKTYFSTSDSAARAGVLTDLGDYMLAGYTSKGNGDYDFFLLELNNDGNIVWSKTFGGTGSQKAYSIAKSQDGYMVVGDVQNPNSATDAWVIKTDLAGKLIWSKTIGGNDADSAGYVTSSRDGDFVVAGFSFSYGEGNRDFWLFKIDSDGQILLSSTWGNQGFQEAYTVLDIGGNDYVMIGWTDPPNQLELIGKATYDFAIVNLVVLPNSQILKGFQGTIYVLIIAATLLSSFVWGNKWRKKIRNG